MKKKIFASIMASVMMACAVPTLAADTLPEKPDNLTIAPNPVISSNPAAPVNRTEGIMSLWEACGKHTVDGGEIAFTDVQKSDDAYQAILWAATKGMTLGVSADQFAPAGELTRQQLAAMIYRYAKSEGKGFRGSWMFYLGSKDISEVSDWATEAMYWMVSSKLYNGEEECLRPNDTVTVAELDAIMEKLPAALGRQKEGSIRFNPD